MTGSAPYLNALFCCLQVNNTKEREAAKPVRQRQVVVKVRSTADICVPGQAASDRGNSLQLVQTFGINQRLPAGNRFLGRIS